jgi:hypothetical protein
VSTTRNALSVDWLASMECKDRRTSSSEVTAPVSS